jgi:hypothetical protein
MNVILPAGTWVNIYDMQGVSDGVDIDAINITPSDVRLVSSATTPTVSDDHIPLIYGRGKATISQGALGAWAFCLAGGAISVSTSSNNVGWRQATSNILPDGVLTGERALTTQSYTEANSKLGVQHESSTLLRAVEGGASNDTIFLTGALPVIIKGRVIGYTGDGVTAEIFEAPTYARGTSVAYQNASAINPVPGLSKIIVGAKVSDDGVLKFAPDHLIGNTSNQGKGTHSSIDRRESLLKRNTAYLLRLTSLDSQDQDIASLLTWYEGELDLPRST